MQEKVITLEDVLVNISSQWQWLSVLMAAITLISLLIGYSLNKANRPAAAAQFMSGPIFITTIPGILFTLIQTYLLFFSSGNLLRTPFFFFIPPIWMAVSLYLFSRLVDFNQVPGFDRLSGLVFFCLVAFAGIFVLIRLRILAVIWFRPMTLILFVFALYFFGRLAVQRIFRK